MTSPRVALSKQFVSFVNSCGGLDLTLRLIQALAIVAAEVSIDHVTVARCTTVTSQLALGRRYLRFFSFIEFFERVRDLLADAKDFASGGAGALLRTMDLVESSCLGLYLLLESSTMLHDMNVWPVSWYVPVLLEGNKFWFYAICTSISRSIWKLLFTSSAAQEKVQKGHSEGDQRKRESKEPSPAPNPAPSAITLLRRIVVDCCDLHFRRPF